MESAFIHVPFYSDGVPLAVATTRPELLYGCTCLFVNPEDTRYKAFIGKSASVPLYGGEIPILSDEKAGMDKGTGVVMCATFGDNTDAEWCAKYNLPYRRVILPDGSIARDVPYISGLSVGEARKSIIRLLDEQGLLLKTRPIVHTVSAHDRCGTPVEIIPSRQWYIDILTDRERYLQAADEINWYPWHMKNRYIMWVKNLKWDWCVSRQRYFGVPIPCWYCADCGKPVFAAPEQLPVNPLETPYTGACECGNTRFIPESAVFDTWTTSSVTPQINERGGLPLVPMSMRTHAHEIIRTWTFYTIVRSLYHTGKLPWKDLMVCGFILAKKGEKISKSKSNSGLDPVRLIAEHSADALRYWTAGAKLGTDTGFSVDELAVSKRFITKLWNAASFAVSHLQDYNPADTPNLLPADRWIIERVNEAARNAASLLNTYETGQARHGIDSLFWRDFCDNYIEIVKERLYKPELHGEDARKSGQRALYYSLYNILKLYAIYVPHITEHIYLSFFKQHEKEASIHLTMWAKPASIDNEIIQFGEKLKDILFETRKYKTERNLSMKAEIDELRADVSPELIPLFKASEKDLLACSKAKRIVYAG